MQILVYLLAFVAVIGIIVTVHEFGHCWVAKKLGVKVLRFSIGLGKPVWSRRFGETEYVLASIPLGGYVKMLDEREDKVAEHEKHRAFNRQPVGTRFAIVSAGPLFNFIFAVFAYWLTFVVGVEGTRPTVGEVSPQSIAWQAEIRANDTFVSVEGVPVHTWQQTAIQLLNGALESGQVRAGLQSQESGMKVVTLDLNDTRQLLAEGNLLEKLGITPWRYAFEPVFGKLTPGVAKTAGIQEGDRVIRLDGEPVESWEHLVQYIQERPGVPVSVVVERDHRPLEFELIPDPDRRDGQTIGRVGAYPFVDQVLLEQQRVVVRYNPFDAVPRSLLKTWEVSILTLKLLWELVKGEASLKNISGPVTIAEYAGLSAAIGFSAFVGALAIISISIGILNLLPIPLLDGGHLFYYLIEILKGSAVSEQTQVMGQRLGIMMLAGLMGLAFYNDIYRLLQ